MRWLRFHRKRPPEPTVNADWVAFLEAQAQVDRGREEQRLAQAIAEAECASHGHIVPPERDPAQEPFSPWGLSSPRSLGPKCERCRCPLPVEKV
jgi:hypothetical protein